MNNSSISSTDKAVFPSALGRGTGTETRREEIGASTPGFVVRPGALECSVGSGEGPVAVLGDSTVKTEPAALLVLFRSLGGGGREPSCGDIGR